MATTGRLSGSDRSTVLPSPDERVTDSDRERAIEELRAHLLAGRLTASEFETGVASLQRALTRRDIADVMVGLPAVPSLG